tara:strand:+ start:1686 stop:2138 length:453 start_codon:yes stop_codon:yes gene_type:complete
MPKQHNREDTEDRTTLYRDIRWKQAWNSRCVQDLDQIEYSVVDGQIVYVAIIELTRRDNHPTIKNPPPRYFDAILERYDSDMQGRLAVETAKKLGVDAYIVVFDEDVERLWVYNFSKRKGFTREFSKKEYFEWLYAKHEAARAAFAKKNC